MAYYFHLWLYYCCNIVVRSLKPFVSSGGGLNIYVVKFRTVPLTLNPVLFHQRVACQSRAHCYFTDTDNAAVSQGPWRLAVPSSTLCTLTGFLLTGNSWTMISSNVFAGKNRGNLSIYSIQLPKVGVEIFVRNHDNLDLCKTRTYLGEEKSV